MELQTYELIAIEKNPKRLETDISDIFSLQQEAISLSSKMSLTFPIEPLDRCVLRYAAYSHALFGCYNTSNNVLGYAAGYSPTIFKHTWPTNILSMGSPSARHTAPLRHAYELTQRARCKPYVLMIQSLVHPGYDQQIIFSMLVRDVLLRAHFLGFCHAAYVVYDNEMLVDALIKLNFTVQDYRREKRKRIYVMLFRFPVR